MKLSRLTYAEIAKRLENESSANLLELVDERSIKVGDTAIDLLSARGEVNLILEALMSGRLTTRNGKVRALNTFCSRGLGMPEAVPAYLLMINDSNPDVVSCALFGLVFWNDPQYLPAIRAIRNPRMENMKKKAITALEAHDPKRYSPHFRDANCVWCLSATAE